MKIALRTIGLIGVLLFGSAFWFTFGMPGFVDDAAKGFIKERIEEETKEKIDSITLTAEGSKLGQIAQRLLESKEVEIIRLKRQLEEKAHERLAGVIAKMRDLNCECRAKYAAMIKRHFEFRIASLQEASEKLEDFMKMKYMEIVKRLTLDIRIFVGSNLAVFVILLAISFLKPQATIQLFLPGILLAISTIIGSYFYLFEQNWFFTIIYNDYVGFGYLVYIGIVFGILCDIVLNRARVTTEIVNFILNSIGSALSAAPC